MKEENYKMASKIIGHYGVEHQKDILIEECAELIQAVEKSRRFTYKPHFTADIIEEMADVCIMLMQFDSLMSVYWHEQFENAIESKLKRQLERIEGERLD